MTQCENCIGSELSFSKNVYVGFDLINAEDYLYSEEGGTAKIAVIHFSQRAANLIMSVTA